MSLIRTVSATKVTAIASVSQVRRRENKEAVDWVVVAIFVSVHRHGVSPHSFFKVALGRLEPLRTGAKEAIDPQRRRMIRNQVMLVQSLNEIVDSGRSHPLRCQLPDVCRASQLGLPGQTGVTSAGGRLISITGRRFLWLQNQRS